MLHNPPVQRFAVFRLGFGLPSANAVSAWALVDLGAQFKRAARDRVSNSRFAEQGHTATIPRIAENYVGL